MKKAVSLFVLLVLIGTGIYVNSPKGGPAPKEGAASGTAPAGYASGSMPVAGEDPIASMRLQAADLSKIGGGPMISFNFDDGLLSTYTKALPIFNKAGFKTTQYIITGAFAKANYMNKEQVLTMYEEGHEIGAHTRTHPHLTQLSSASATDEIRGSKEDLIAMGIMPTTFAYPYGDWNPAVEKIVKDAGFAGARITVPQYNDRTVDPFVLKRQRIQADTSFDDVKRAVDDAIAKKKWVILVMHGIGDGGPEDITVEMLQRVVDYVKQANVPVVTTAEGLQVLQKVR